MFFWTDPWIGGVALAVRFRRLYELSVNKHCTMEDMFGLGRGKREMLGSGEGGCEIRRRS